MYTQILVPLDGSAVAARALTVAARLSATFDAPMRIVGWASPSTVDDLRNQIDVQVAQSGVVGIEVAVGSTDDVAEAISAEVENRPGTLVCMSSTGRSHIGAALGSVAEAALRHYVDPVLLIGPECDVTRFRPDGPMVVCVDGSPNSEAAVPIATSWAIALHDPVEVVIVADPEVQREFARNVAASADLPSETGYPHRIARRIEGDLGRTVNYEVLHNHHPSRAIVEHLESQQASLAVVATHGSAGLDRLVVGSVAMDVVHRAPCPVLVTRPPHLPR